MCFVVPREDIIDYYVSSQWLYTTLWSPVSHGMHVGFWDTGVRSVDQAVENENRTVMKTARVTDHSRVLDAGCGLGSTAIYIGRHSHASVVGVTLVLQQAVTATRYARKANVYPRVSFRVADYSRLPFPDASFDVVIGIESVCHAYPKELFLREAHRVLIPGGRLVIADGYLRHNIQTSHERKLYHAFCSSFALSELIVAGVMKEKIKSCLFRRVRWVDMTRSVENGARQFYARYMLLRFLLPVIAIFPFAWARSIVRNARAGYASMGLFTSGVGCYGIFIAVK